jgi:signal transduction histidine kinase
MTYGLLRDTGPARNDVFAQNGRRRGTTRHEVAFGPDNPVLAAQLRPDEASVVRELRAELAASREREAAAGEAARRCIQRDLHDGAQARLVSVVLALSLARRELGDAAGPVVELVDEALVHAEGASAELRNLVHGILPAALSQGGLRAAIDALVSRVRLPISVEVTAQRLPAPLEANAYLIVAEALTNVIRHAHATSVQVAAVADTSMLRLEIRDDGVGGARCNGSSGLVGLRDRAAALNGQLRVESLPDRGTVVVATLPIPASKHEAAGAYQPTDWTHAAAEPWLTAEPDNGCDGITPIRPPDLLRPT